MDMLRFYLIIPYFLVLLVGCAGGPVQIQAPQPMTPSAECNARLDALTAGLEGTSLIRAKVPNPCDAYKVLATVAQVGVVWEQWKADAVVQWAEMAKKKVAARITYNDLIIVLDTEIQHLNGKLAGTYLLVTGLVVNVQSPEIISPKDAAILQKGLDGIIADAKRMAALQS